MANGVTTEWEDLQVKHGNYIARPKEKPIELPIYDLTNQLSQNEDDESDEQIFKLYKIKRMQQMMQKPKFGELYEITREEYIKEIYQISQSDGWVVLHLYQDYKEECILINNILNELAYQFANVKFVKMIATRCISNFRDEDLACIVLYRNGKKIKSLLNFDTLVRKITFVSIEHLLKQFGVFKQQEEQEDDEEND